MGATNLTMAHEGRRAVGCKMHSVPHTATSHQMPEDRDPHIYTLRSALSISSSIGCFELKLLQVVTYESPLQEHHYSVLIPQTLKESPKRSTGSERTPAFILELRTQGCIHNLTIIRFHHDNFIGNVGTIYTLSIWVPLNLIAVYWSSLRSQLKVVYLLFPADFGVRSESFRTTLIKCLHLKGDPSSFFYP